MLKRKHIVILAGLLVPPLLAFSAFATYFHIMLPDRNILVSEPDAHAYFMNEKHVLLVWRNTPFIINPIDRFVGNPSDYRNRLLGRNFWPRDSSLVFWPRGSYAGVAVGDAVKRDGREKFEFVNNQVRIQAFFSPANTQLSEIVVELPNAN